MKRFLRTLLLATLGWCPQFPAHAALGDPTYQGIWWASPADSESGWGVNLTHQGDILFATWFTYDTDGSPLWLVMPNGALALDPGTMYTDTYGYSYGEPPKLYFRGALYRTTGPAFSSATFNASAVVATAVGTARFDFIDANNGTFTYTVNGMNQSKAITRQVFAAPVPECTAGGTAGSTPNYQDLWWKAPADTESGWGLNIAHQGSVLFVTWFTYGADGKGLWLVMPNARPTAANAYSGAFYRTRGPAFNAMPWTGTVTATEVGTGTLTFTGTASATFAYSIDGTSQSKAIMRQSYATPASVCRNP